MDTFVVFRAIWTVYIGLDSSVDRAPDFSCIGPGFDSWSNHIFSLYICSFLLSLYSIFVQYIFVIHVMEKKTC